MSETKQLTLSDYEETKDYQCIRCGYIITNRSEAPSLCMNCGKPRPWRKHS